MSHRVDRLTALRKQLLKIGIPLEHEKVCIPNAPVPEDTFGFASKGVHGNFLSHLDILSRAIDDHRRNVLVLEDDAIFRTQFHHANSQEQLLKELSENAWDFCFIGHSVPTSRLAGSPPLVKYNEPFKWSHCYLVNARALPPIVEYLQQVLVREPGHPAGGKMYIDGAFSHYRRLNPHVACWITKPCMSIQAGSPSGLGRRSWYDQNPITSKMTGYLRKIRDDFWRATGCFPTR